MLYSLNLKLESAPRITQAERMFKLELRPLRDQNRLSIACQVSPDLGDCIFAILVAFGIVPLLLVEPTTSSSVRRDPTDWANASAFHAIQSPFDEVSLLLGEHFRPNQSINRPLFGIDSIIGLLSDCQSCKSDLLVQRLSLLDQLSLVLI